MAFLETRHAETQQNGQRRSEVKKLHDQAVLQKRMGRTQRLTTNGE